jgi:hypothetical protein
MTTKLTARQRDKLIEAAQNAITFQVEGTWDFPLDMLRYDLCWPASQSDAGLIAGTTLVGKAERRITLKGLKLPTEARWVSFGWKVVSAP